MREFLEIASAFKIKASQKHSVHFVLTQPFDEVYIERSRNAQDKPNQKVKAYDSYLPITVSILNTYNSNTSYSQTVLSFLRMFNLWGPKSNRRPISK